MAENQKVFVSPGVYTAEKDLTFVAQSVGVTTLGLAGETKKGPAFEPIFIDSFDSFRTRFGETDPEKFTESQIPKYETSFIARSYLSQSNQLFVTRVLGLSGYDAGPSWQLLTIGELDPLHVATNSTANTATGWSQDIYIPLTGGTINTSNIYTGFSNSVFSSALSGMNRVMGGSGPFRTANQITGETMYNGDGGAVGTLVGEMSHFTNNVLDNDQGAFNITGATEFYYYGYVPTACTTTAFPQITGNTGLPVDVYNRLGVNSDLGPGADGAGATYPNAINSADFSGDTNDGWFNSLFDYGTGGTDCTNSCYSGGSFAMFASSASTATTYVEGVTLQGVSGSSDNLAVVGDTHAILKGIISPQATTYVTNIDEYTGCTSATSWSEWSFYGAAVGNDQTDDGIAKIDNYYSYSAGTTGWTNTTGVQTGNGGSLALSAYQPTIYPFVGAFGTGSTLSSATLTRTAAQYSGAVSDYTLQNCAGTSIGGSSPAYTAVQVTLSGFSSQSFIHGVNSNVFTQGSTVVHSLSSDTTTSVNWFSGTGLSAFTTFYTGSCSAVTYLAMTLSGCYSTYDCVSADTEYHNMTIATLRSRGESTLTTGGPVYKISASTGDGYKQGGVDFNCSGVYEDITRDPFASFGISAKTDEGVISKFTTSLDSSNKNYISRVLGRKVFDREANDIPIFVEEIYPNLLKYLYRRQKIRGINCCLCYRPAARFNNTNRVSLGWYMNQWQTPATPYLVSELRGTEVSRLFRFVSISDGTAANREHKISITNISFERVEFDVVVRDFYDTDANPIVLEKYTRCTLDPTAPNFIARKIGTSDGEYELRSTYTMLELTDAVIEGDLKDALPAGFEGYKFRESCTNTTNPYPKWKTKYYTPGETIFDPYFNGSGGASNASISAGDNLRKNYLGFANGDGAAIDFDFFEYKGFKTPSSVCTMTTGSDWPTLTQGFHMDSGATVVIAGSGSYLTETASTLSGKSMFMVGDASFQSEPTSTEDPYYKIQSRKFTVAPYGGFDGWDEYRKTRTNQDGYRLGMTGYKYGACADSSYTDASGLGSFKKISTTDSNTDYDAYKQAIRKFENPEAVDINVFATPGIDTVNNLALVNDTIDMIETERADSLYITTTPDYNLFVNTTSDASNQISPTEAVNNMEDSFIDSNYTATYYPWVLVRDNNTNKQLYIPPTGEVMRNLALTDNIAFPWFASAGYTRGIVNAIKARKKLTLDERDTLYVGRINPIATFSDVGPIIFGNKTLQVKESALDRINVRRLLLQTRKLISAVAVRLLFEQNDDVVRQQFLDLVNPILDSIRRDRGLTDFRVVLSNDPEEIDRNELNGKIYIKPTRALEFIFIEFLITPTGASFEDI